jgi:hypothetical protein
VLYVLQNLAAADVEQAWRYAIGLQDDGYLAVRPDDEEYALYAQVSKEVALELMPELNMTGTLLNYAEWFAGETKNLNAGAGANTLGGVQQASGYVAVVEHIAAMNINTNPTYVQIRIDSAAGTIPIKLVTTPGAGAWVVWEGRIHLSSDEQIKADFGGCSAGDDLYLRIRGYTMGLVE